MESDMQKSVENGITASQAMRLEKVSDVGTEILLVNVLPTALLLQPYNFIL